MSTERLISVKPLVLEKALRDAGLIRFDTDSHVVELRALLDAPAPCTHEWTDDDECTLTCTKCGKTETHEPYGWVQTRGNAINHFTQEWDVVESWEDQGFEYKAMFDHAEQPAPVAVVLPERYDMPHREEFESADRCTKAHEYLFLLSKSPRYYYDQDAIKEPVALSSITRMAQDLEQQRGSDRVPGKSNGPMKAVRSKRDSFKRDDSKREQPIPGQSLGTHRPDREESAWALGTRNKRSVWTVPTQGFKGAHFATFPPDLIRPCILAGAPRGGIVLDPFGGAGTTAVVAMQEGRKSIMCELNPEYAAMAERRIASAWLDGAAQMDVFRDAAQNPAA